MAIIAPHLAILLLTAPRARFKFVLLLRGVVRLRFDLIPSCSDLVGAFTYSVGTPTGLVGVATD